MNTHIDICIQASFGHLKSSRHPGMKPFLYSTLRQLPIDLIDPAHTQSSIQRARERLLWHRERRSLVLWVGPDDVARIIHQLTSDAVISGRWPGGLLTNFAHVKYSPSCPVRLNSLPDLVILMGKEDRGNTLRELGIMGVESMGIVDSNQNPKDVDLPIFANNDSAIVREYITQWLLD